MTTDNPQSLLRRFFEKGKSLFTGVWKKIFYKKPGKTRVTDPNTEKETLDDDDAFEKYIDDISGSKDIISQLGIHSRVGASLKHMYEMGRRDGALGVTLHNLADIARGKAEELYGHIYMLVKGNFDMQTADRNMANNLKENDEALYRREQAYYDYVMYQYRLFPRSNSWVLFIFYSLIAAMLILADIPLAVILIEKGFNLPGGPIGLEFSQLFTDDFWTIVANNWQTLITAVGIAFCTVYVKIWYDEFVGTPYANRFMTFKSFVKDNKIGEGKEEEKDIKGEHKTKKAIKLVFFGITIIAIVVIAVFRLEVAARNHEFVVTSASGAAFIAITLLFPLIGGICLSYALTNGQNRSRLRNARIQCNRIRRKCERTIKRFTVIEKKHKDLEAAYIRLSHEQERLNEYMLYLVAFYERGYSIGMMQPQKYSNGQDFFTKLLEWRNMAISRKINTHIGHLK